MDTPCLLLDEPRMTRNLARLRARLDALGVALRPHLKTAKSVDVARRMMPTPAGPATVSTLKEAEHFAAHGVTDIVYAVGIEPGKFARVAALLERGVELAVVLDSVEVARALSAFAAARGVRAPVLLEIDTDGHRSGLAPGAPELLDVARALTATPAGGATPRGVLTHAGESYACRGVAELEAMAEQERAGAVQAATRLRAAGVEAPVVSVGSTPTAHFARALDGVTEVRAGVHVFFDLVMAGLGVCAVDDIALSVCTSVIGHQAARGWLLVDAGWMALSRDRGTAAQPVDQGYGLVCDAGGRVLPDLIVRGANQEHGIIARRDGAPWDMAAFPAGTRLRILPNHACATAAAHDAYHVLDARGDVVARWERINGW
ncbi:MAG: alanine racemase [Gemmatimonadales bacterium]|nr:alanine racemase [Gemmatimonadales bacterium]